MVDTTGFRLHFGLIALVSIIAILVLFTSEFGGHVSAVDMPLYVLVYPGSSPASTIFLALLAGLFIANLRFGLRYLGKSECSKSEIRTDLKRIKFLLSAILILSAAAAAYLKTAWHGFLGPGFYSSALAGLMGLASAKIVSDELKLLN